MSVPYPSTATKQRSQNDDHLAELATRYIVQNLDRTVGWDEVSNRNEWAKAPVPVYPASEEIDLESALEALDVDLDDLSTSGAPVPHAPTELARAGSSAGRATIRPPSQGQDPKRKSSRIPRGRAPRANTDDGVLIDFDDDDE